MVVEVALQCHAGKVAATQSGCVISLPSQNLLHLYAVLGPIISPDKMTD